MDNIFENAKFGDKFRTRDGRKAIYLASYDIYFSERTIVDIIIEGDPRAIRCLPNGKIYSINMRPVDIKDCKLDIVSKWEDHIDDEKLNTLIEDYLSYIHEEYMDEYQCPYFTIAQLKESFKTGYHKALMEK